MAKAIEESNEDMKIDRPRHIVQWASNLIERLRAKKSALAALEMLRGNKEISYSLANYHVDEAIAIVQSAVNFETGLVLPHPEVSQPNLVTESTNNIVSILVDDINPIHDIVRFAMMNLLSKYYIRLVVKPVQKFSASLVTSLVELMHASGATPQEITYEEYNKTDRHIKSIHSSKASKLSIVAVVFSRCDTFAAAQGIIEGYFRESYPNLNIFVEEAAYDLFVKDWQRYYSHVLSIGPELSPKTVVSDVLNNKIDIDLAAVDVKTSSKSTGHSINVIRFRNLADLLSLTNKLRKVPLMSLWHDDTVLLRDLCNEIQCCDQFWLRHLPSSHHGRKFDVDLIEHYADYFNQSSANTFNSVNMIYASEIENLRQQQASFLKLHPKLRMQLIINSFINVVSKCKSLLNGSSVSAGVAKLQRFAKSLHYMSELNAGESRLEIQIKPSGFIIIDATSLVTKVSSSSSLNTTKSISRVQNDDVSLSPDEFSSSSSENEGLAEHQRVHKLEKRNPNASASFSSSGISMKTKSSLTELIFKNLLLGNAVFVCCPQNALGAKFAFDNDHLIPFKMVHPSEVLPDVSKLSLDQSSNLSDSMSIKQSGVKKLCPRGTFAIEFTSSFHNESVESIILALGAKHRLFWFPDAIQTNYWSDK